MERDIINFDYLSVSVKSSQLDRILACYQALGWSEISRADDNQFFDMKYLVLSRPHDINNKDRLQYIQVKTENLINSLSHTVTYKHAKSTSIAISSCVFAVCFLILGLVFTFAVNAAYSLPIYIISYALAFVCVLGIILPLAIFRKREERVAQEKIKEHLKKIENLMAQVKKIFADDENQKITLKGEENFINADNNYDDVYDVEAEGGKR